MLTWTGTEQLVGVIAHDLGNALGVIINNAMFVAEDLPADSVAAQDVREVLVSARKAALLLGQLGIAASAAPTGAPDCDLGGLTGALEPVLRHGLGRQVDLTVQIDENLPRVRGDPGPLTRAMLATVLARRDELDEGAALNVHVHADVGGRCVLVDVRGAAVTFSPVRAGGRGLTRVAGGRLEARQAPAGIAALSLVMPIADG